MRPRTDRQTHRQTHVTTIHFASSTTHAKCNNHTIMHESIVKNNVKGKPTCQNVHFTLHNLHSCFHQCHFILSFHFYFYFITFCMRHSPGEMYIGNSCLCLAAFPQYCTDPDVTWGNGRGCPLVVHYSADLQSVHGVCCYDNTHLCKLIALYTANAYSAECEMSASACTRSMAGYIYYISRES